jgi:ferredoxin-NADP reductase
MKTQLAATETTSLPGAPAPARTPLGLPFLTSMTFVSSSTEHGGVTSLSFRPKHPLRFRAGQHGLLIVRRGGVKPFSIASSPSQDLVMIGTRLSSGSKFKLALAALQPGDTVRFFGPLMNFTADRASTDVVFLAQGVGITPIRSMLLDITQRRVEKSTTLVHVGTDHPFRIETEALANRALYPSDAETFRTQLAEVAEDHKSATFMISGAPAFVTSTQALLQDHAIPAGQIKLDSMRG